jgi:hypothetical protein
MAYRSGKARISSVGGIFGLKVEIVGDVKTANALAQLPTAVQRRVARQAIAAKARPIQAAMKAGARQASLSSKRQEGIGTTSRAIATKVGTSKRQPWVTYAKVGARRGYTEFVTLQDETKRSAPSKVSVVKQIRRGRGRRGVREDRVSLLKNMSARTRHARLDPKSNSTRKRVPSRYLHLIEKGTRRSRAYRFMAQAAQVGKTLGQAAYMKIMDEGIKREFAKMAAKAA